MRHTSRRLLTGSLLVLAAGAGSGLAPAPALAAVTATVDVRATLKIRSAPSLAAKVVGSVRDGQQVGIQCSVTGQSVHGKVRTTTLWDKLADGRFISHSYVLSTQRIPTCVAAAPKADPVKAKPAPSQPAQTKPAAVTTGTVRSTDGAVNVRSGASTQSAVVRSLANGATVQQVCHVAGARVDGTVRTTNLWSRLTDGTYVSYAYVVSPSFGACPPEKSAPVPAAPTPEQFIAAAVPGAQQGWREFGVPASVTIAQAILESGWGKSGLSSVDRNYFGIKCQNGRYGSYANGCHVYPTTECDKAGQCFMTADAFRTYASMAHSFRDHGSFLKVNSRYQPAFAYTRDANKFIWQVWKAGYATDPKYYTKVTSLMASYDLYRYDTWK